MDTWNAAFEAAPSNLDMIGAGNEAIQDTRAYTRERINAEHEMDPAASPPQARHGAHRQGSAVPYVSASAPTLTPAGNALSASDAGRLWFDTTTKTLKEYSGSAWQELVLNANTATDADSANTSGVWAITTPFTNTPTGAACQIITVNDPVLDAGFQIANPVGVATPYVRNKASGTWEASWTLLGSGGAGAGSNFLKKSLTDASSIVNNSFYEIRTDAGTAPTSAAWSTDVTALTLLNAGAFKVVTGGANRILDIYLNTLDPNDVGQPFMVKFTYKTDTNAACVVSLFDNSTDTPTAIGALPLAGGSVQVISGAVFPTTTIGANTQRLRFTFNAACTMYLADVSVAPYVATSGAAVGNWTSYTPNLVGIGSKVFTKTAQWRRVGSSMEIAFNLSSDASAAGAGATVTTMDIPAGYTIDTSAFGVGGSAILGFYQEYSIIVNAQRGPSMEVYAATTNTVAFLKYGTAISITQDDLNVARIVSLIGKITIPITQWTSNINLATDFTEYASNSKSDNTATDMTSFAYGSGGSLFPNGAVGTTYSRRIRFTKPFQVTDKITIEFAYPAVGEWKDIQSRFPYIELNSKVYGASIVQVAGSSTDFDVTFATGGCTPATAATYGANGYAWSNLAAIYWRVRKVSNGNMAEQPDSIKPIGEITMFAGASAPNGWLMCDGAQVSRSAYARLYGIIGTTWGTGDGSTTFNVPDLREAVPVGAGTQAAVSGSTRTAVGATNHDGATNTVGHILGASREDRMQGHRHAQQAINTGGAQNRILNDATGNSTYGATMPASSIIDPTFDGVNGTPRTGTTTSPKVVAVNYIIRWA